MTAEDQALSDLAGGIAKLSTDTSASLTAISAVLTQLASNQADPAAAGQIEAAVASLATIDANIQAAATAAQALVPAPAPAPAPVKSA